MANDNPDSALNVLTIFLLPDVDGSSLQEKKILRNNTDAGYDKRITKNTKMEMWWEKNRIPTASKL